ncbi:hypothetical protein AGDE_13517 [Angomonas deanei]|nr:hypothetical protein AGDE_13517 [Angomonas deanei]|eukprot:EPY22255.1 hypothetical protein AGDE_13517 [Angomonas deanei]
MFHSFPTNELTAPLFSGMFVVFSFYLVGMIIFIFKIPERWFPGQFDLFLNSHQLWHIFVLLATMNHYFFCAGAFQWWRVTGMADRDCR